MWNRHMCLEVAYPLASVRARIGRAMVSFATLINMCGFGSARSVQTDARIVHTSI